MESGLMLQITRNYLDNNGPRFLFSQGLSPRQHFSEILQHYNNNNHELFDKCVESQKNKATNYGINTTQPYGEGMHQNTITLIRTKSYQQFAYLLHLPILT